MSRCPKRIAIVDDDPRIAELMQEFLVDEGYEVTLCECGERTLPAIESLRPDAIVLDVRMAGINGLGILYLLSIGAATRDIPVLLCTASSSHEMGAWHDVLDQKGIPILYKPFSLGELAETVSALLSGEFRRARAGFDAEGWHELDIADRGHT